jgi:hypothetical protein
MEEAKIHFSGTETELMSNAGVILTKNIILHKIKVLLESIQFEMQLEVQSNSQWFTHPVFQPNAKISKGENYLGLPYMVLDYPRSFDVTNIFAVRTFFWWGNFFSSTLHITGDYKTAYFDNIINAYDALATAEYYISNNEDQWTHHFEEGNYTKIDDLSKEEFINYCHQFDHIKIAAKWPLWEWDFAATNLFKSWKLLLNICIS